MATLSTLTLDGDGTIGAEVVHDAGTGSPFYTHGNDTPNGGSSDWVANDQNETSTTAWFSLSNVNSDFDSMSTLNIDVDVQAVGFSNDNCTLTARIYAADNNTTNPLTAESGNLGTQADGTRTQRNVTFSSLAGTKTQWDGAYIRFTWTYSKVTGPDNGQLRLYGCDIDGTYSAAATNYTLTAAQGSFSETGQSAGTLADRLLALAQGAFTQTGQAATLSFGYSLPLAQGSFTQTGQSANFLRGYAIITLPGDFVLSGQALNMLRGLIMALAQGSFTETGQSAGTLRGYPIVAAQGSFSETGQTAGFTADRQLTAAQGSISEAGQASNLLLGFILGGSQGSFGVTGQASELDKSNILLASKANFGMTGQDVMLTTGGGGGETYEDIYYHGDPTQKWNWRVQGRRKIFNKAIYDGIKGRESYNK